MYENTRYGVLKNWPNYLLLVLIRTRASPIFLMIENVQCKSYGGV
jgi:hypothetical protein